MNDALTLQLSTTISNPHLIHSLEREPTLGGWMIAAVVVAAMAALVYREVKKTMLQIRMERNNYVWSNQYQTWRCRYSARPDIQ